MKTQKATLNELREFFYLSNLLQEEMQFRVYTEGSLVFEIKNANPLVKHELTIIANDDIFATERVVDLLERTGIKYFSYRKWFQTDLEISLQYIAKEE